MEQPVGWSNNQQANDHRAQVSLCALISALSITTFSQPPSRSPRSQHWGKEEDVSRCVCKLPLPSPSYHHEQQAPIGYINLRANRWTWPVGQSKVFPPFLELEWLNAKCQILTGRVDLKVNFANFEWLRVSGVNWTANQTLNSSSKEMRNLSLWMANLLLLLLLLLTQVAP